MILVTGGTGFIGRKLIERLVRLYPPSEILALIYPRTENILEQTGRAILRENNIASIPADLRTGEGLEHVPTQVDILFHLASNTDTGARDHRINDIGTKKLLDHVTPKRMIFTSTISVSDHRTNPHQPGNESSLLLQPFSEYGRKKLQTENLLKEQCKLKSFGLSILRVSATYGKGTRKKGLFDQLVTLAKKESLLGRFDYPGRMTMMHVDDVADILALWSLQAVEPGTTTTCIADAEELSISEMSEAIANALVKPWKPIHIPNAFWKALQTMSPIVYSAEPILPHRIYNKIWQLTLLINNGYYNISQNIRSLFPNKTFKKFKDTANDLLSV